MNKKNLTKNIQEVSQGKVTYNIGLYGKQRKGIMPLVQVAGFLCLFGAVVWGAATLTSGSSLSVGENEEEKPNIEPIVKTISPSDGETTLKLNAYDAINQSNGMQFLAGTATVVGAESSKQTVTLTTSSTPTNAVVNVGETVDVFAQASGYYPAEITEISSKVATFSQEVPLKRSATPQLKVFDIAANAYVGTWNSSTSILTVPSISLTAGGASKTYRIDAIVNDAYSQFGDLAILAADDASITKYEIGSSFTKLNTPTSGIALANSMTNDNKKNMYKLPIASLDNSAGQTTLGTMTIKLKSGQSASDITVDLYDKAKFLSVDGKTSKIGVDKDDESSSDVGATNPSIVFSG